MLLIRKKKKLNNKDSKRNHTWALRIVKIGFCNIPSHSFSERSGPGPLRPVRKILVVRSGMEGPQFARSVGTLVRTNLTVEWMDGQWSTKVLWFNVFISHSTQYHEDANRSSFYIKPFLFQTIKKQSWIFSKSEESIFKILRFDHTASFDWTLLKRCH